jgi:hypothetical protein
MKFSIPFLAYNLDQLPLPGTYENQCVEAIVFNREDLEQPKWELVWKGVKAAIGYYQPENVSFHFPVNHSDYVADPFVKERLIETLERASEFGMAGVVVHSNRVTPFQNWIGVNLETERQKVIDTLVDVRRRSSSQTWLALENMPVMDNYGIEVDPLFVYPEDFKELRKTDVKVVFDICHFSNTQANIRQVLSGEQDRKYYPNVRDVGDFDFLSIVDLIVHWHFSSFLGIANPDTREICKEGVIPSKGSLGESYYREAFQKIVQAADPSGHMVFEIQEKDYKNRLEAGEMLKWAYSLLPAKVR